MKNIIKDLRRKDHKRYLGGLDIFRYIGPGLLVTVGFIDPGNWASNFAAGSEFGYSLLWVVTLSTVMLILLQHNVAHLGIVTGLCLSEAATEYTPKWVARPVLGSAVIASVSTSLAEILGGAIALQMLADGDRAHAHGRTGVEQVAHLECHETAHVGNNLVYGEQHVARATALHRLSVDVQMETDVLHVAEILHGHPRADDGRTVEPLAQLPRVARLAETALQVARREVDAHGHRIVVAVGKTLGDALAKAAYPHCQRCAEVNVRAPVGHEEWLAVL